jgi:phosphoribosylaminoimidazole carboxylase PurK protein
MVNSPQELTEALQNFAGQPLYAERLVPFTKELAIMVAKGQSTVETETYPLTETMHQRNICIETLTPANVDEKVSKQAEKLANDVAQQLEGSGVFGIEMFLTEDNLLLINEIAPRVHNSGHYTIEACETSQFEQHIRAITGIPLGSTDLKVPTAVMVNILGERDGETEVKGQSEAEKIPGVSVHFYGKSPTKVDRKMGHITAVGDTVEEARERAHKARKLISI